MNKLLSIIIPSYNMEKLLDKCLTSLNIKEDLIQYLEVLVINDGSKDNTSAIAHKYEQLNSSVYKVIDKENGNYGSCINKALELLTGKYVKVLDADDYFETENLEAFIKLLAEHQQQQKKVDCYFTDFVMEDSEGNAFKTVSYDINANQVLDFSALDASLTQILAMHSITYRADLFKQINYKQSEGISYTDQEWIFQPMSAVKTVYHLPLVIYHYLVGRDGQTINPDVQAKNLWMEFVITKKLIDIYFEIENSLDECHKNFLYKKITDRCFLMYFYVLIAFHKYENEELLLDFDSYLSSKSQKLMNEIKELDFNSYKFIKKWKTTKRRKSLYFSSLRLSISIKNLFRRLFK